MGDARVAPGAVDDEVDRPLDAGRHDPGHPVVLDNSPLDGHAVLDGHAGQGGYASTDDVLEQRPGKAEHRPAPVPAGSVGAALEHPRSVSVGVHGSLGHEFVLDTGEPVAQQIQPSGQEQVQVPALWHVAARCDGIREPLAFEHDNRRLVGHGSRREQAGHAAPDNDHPRYCHGTPPTRCRTPSRLVLDATCRDSPRSA